MGVSALHLPRKLKWAPSQKDLSAALHNNLLDVPSIHLAFHFELKQAI